jgi:hypothetical protein
VRRKRIVTAALLALLAGQSGRAAAQVDDLGWVDWDKLAAGGIEIKTTKEDRGTVSIDLAIAIHADWKTIWDQLTACEVSPEYVPHVVSCRKIDTVADGTAELFLQTVKPAFFLPKFEHVFRLDYFPPDRIEVSHVSGPIDRLEGAWRLIQQSEGTIILVHSMTLKPGFPVPRFFVRNTLEHDLPEVLQEIRKRAEAASTH